MARWVSPVGARFLLAPRFAVLSAPVLFFAILFFATVPAQAQSQPLLPRVRSWVTRLVGGLVGSLESRLTRPGGDTFRFGRDLMVNDGENPDDVVCLLCSAHIDGAAKGDLLVFAGNAYLNGPVQGDVVDLGGLVTLTGKARIGGDLILFGGRLRQDPASTIGHKRLIVGPIVFLPMVLIIAVLIAGLIFLLRVLFGRFGYR